MTDTIRYIDTDVVGGLGDGTSWANAYASMALWSTAEAAVVGTGDRHLAYFRGTTEDAASAALDFTADGWSGLGELHLIGDGVDNPTTIDPTKYTWKAFNVASSFMPPAMTFKLFNMQRKFNGNYPSSAFGYSSGGTAFKGLVQDHCVDDWRANTASLRISLVVTGTDPTTGTFDRTNTLVLGVLTHDLFMNYNSGGTYNTSNTTIESVNTTLSTVLAASTVNYTDTAIGGTFTASSKTVPTFTNCATEAGIGTNAVTVTDWDLEFTDAANDDFSLLATSQLLGAGSIGNNIGVDQTQVNVDPVLDTPQADVTIQEGQTGTIDAGANFSDANAGDTLTFSDDLNIGAETGFGFNTSTGVITYEGTQVEGVYSVEITASDGNGGSYPTDSFTITVTAPALSIDSIDDANPTVGDQITVGHSNALDTLTTPDFTISSQDGTEAVLDIPDITSLVLTGETYPTINFDEAVTITLSDGTNTADVNLTGIQKPAGTLFAEITENNANGVYNPTPSIVAGMFGYFYEIVGNWVIDPATGLNAVDPAGGSFKYKIYNGEWGAEQTRAIAAETEAPVITLKGNASMVWVQGTPWVDPQATVTDNRDATRLINADSAPNINTPAVYTLNYNATDVAGNVATTVVRTVTVSGADVTPNQFNFVDVSNAELNTLYENTQQITGVDVGQTLTATNGLLSNDGGSTWDSSVQFVSGQTYVKASLTTTGDNSTANTVTVTVNGIQSTFTVTTKAAVTRTFTIGSSDAVVDSDGDNVTYTFPIWELWDKIPEDTTAVKVDSGVNFSVSNGVGSVQTSSGQLATNYIFIARDSGNTPENYIRTVGQVQ